MKTERNRLQVHQSPRAASHLGTSLDISSEGKLATSAASLVALHDHLRDPARRLRAVSIKSYLRNLHLDLHLLHNSTSNKTRTSSSIHGIFFFPSYTRIFSPMPDLRSYESHPISQRSLTTHHERPGLTAYETCAAHSPEAQFITRRESNRLH